MWEVGAGVGSACLAIAEDQMRFHTSAFYGPHFEVGGKQLADLLSLSCVDHQFLVPHIVAQRWWSLPSTCPAWMSLSNGRRAGRSMLPPE